MLREWHVTPEYVNRRWTSEELHLLIAKRNESLKPEEQQGKTTRVSDQELFHNMGITVGRA